MSVGHTKPLMEQRQRPRRTSSPGQGLSLRSLAHGSQAQGVLSEPVSPCTMHIGGRYLESPGTFRSLEWPQSHATYGIARHGAKALENVVQKRFRESSCAP